MYRPEPGTLVGHYRLERPLGAGGMGEVFLARDTRLKRRVAIKFLTRATDDHARRQLLREARAIAAVDHPGICGVHEVASDPAAGDFIVMQYVEGETLAARLARGPMPAGEALELADAMAAALQAAHTAGVIHRDLKPQNVILTADGSPRLLDFGIARRVPVRPDDDHSTTTASADAGVFAGTPAYMAPEQVEGRPVDARTDLFALGCVLYECLTGRRAFTGPTAVAVLHHVLHDDPSPPSTVTKHLDPRHDALCARLLAKAPADRPASATEVRAAIAALTAGGEPWVGAGRDTASRRLPRRVVHVAAMATLVAIAAAAWAWSGRAVTAAPVPAAAERWFERGLDLLREGSYESARAAFQEAVGLHPAYVEAYARLAEASAEADDERDAQAALLKVTELVPDATRLAASDRLRLDAVRASVLHEPVKAIAAYRALAEAAPSDPGGWLDVGRAEEADGNRAAARDAYAEAVRLDPQRASAHLRLGAMQAHNGDTASALASVREAIRLYAAASNVEGEAEAQLRLAIIHNNTSQAAPARAAANRVVELAADPRYLSLRLRARFELARTAVSTGALREAETLATDAVREATDASLPSVAADGLIDLGTTLMIGDRLTDADARFDRAIDLAGGGRAPRTEMRARLQQASLRLRQDRYDDALALSEAPLAFYAGGRYPRLEATAKNIRSRALEYLERYDDASRLADEVLRFADRIGDDGLAAVALDNLAGQLTKLGALPRALGYRQRIEDARRAQNAHVYLAYALVSRAELLIQLGRGAEADAPLAEVEQRIAEGHEAYTGRRNRVALARALQAAAAGRDADVIRYADRVDRSGEPTETSLLAQAAGELARVHLGRARATTETLVGWARAASSSSSRREIAWRVGLALLARGEPGAVPGVAREAAASARAVGNRELAWRLQALVALAGRAAGDAAAATAAAEARNDFAALSAAWGDGAGAYLQRRDLSDLRSVLNTPSETSGGPS